MPVFTTAHKILSNTPKDKNLEYMILFALIISVISLFALIYIVFFDKPTK